MITFDVPQSASGGTAEAFAAEVAQQSLVVKSRLLTVGADIFSHLTSFQPPTWEPFALLRAGLEN